MIKEVKSKPDELIIKMLEEVLERAKTGDIRSIAIVGLNDDGSGFNQFQSHYNPVQIVGELRLIERDIIDLCCDTRRKVGWDFVE